MNDPSRVIALWKDSATGIREISLEPGAHVVITDGQDSYRLAQATAGKGVMPLT